MRVAMLGLVALTTAACGQPGEPNIAGEELVAPRPPGLVRRSQIEEPSASPHLSELVIVDDLIYVANANAGVAIYELGSDGGLAALGATNPPSGGTSESSGTSETSGATPRCTSLAVHEPTASLYCANDLYIGVVRFDLGDPRAPVSDGTDFNPPLVGLRVADQVVIGDRLVLARYDEGLASAAIGDDGRLSELHEQPELGDVRRVDVDAEGRLWALTRDRGLLVLERGPDPVDGWVELARIELDGPPLGLRVAGTRAALALGSAGLALVDFDANAGLRQTHAISPPGVVTAADLEADASVAVAVTLLGVFAYDLRDPGSWPADPRGEPGPASVVEGDARLLGFSAAGPWDRPGDKGTMLDGALIERDGALELITTDWGWVERFRVEPDGFPAGVDVRRGEYLAAEAATVTIAVHNPTPFEQRIDHQRPGDLEWTVEALVPESTTELVLDAARFEIDTPQLLVVRVWDGDSVVDELGVTILRRAPIDGGSSSALARPPPGAEFPPLVLATGWPGSIEPLMVPVPGVHQRVVFYAIDCQAMWPEVEDLLWQVRSGRLDRDEVVLASHVDPTVEGALDRWGLDDARWGYFDLAPPEIAQQNPFSSLYEDGFVIQELPAAAHHPTDYEIDEVGRVVVVEREYRGTHGR